MEQEQPPPVGPIMKTFIALVYIAGFILLAMYVKTCIIPIAFPPEKKPPPKSEFQEWRDRKLKNLYAEVRNAATHPCESTLEFVKIPPQGWQITCEDCTLIPASSIYPELIAKVEHYAKDGKLALLTLLHLEGKCLGFG